MCLNKFFWIFALMNVLTWLFDFIAYMISLSKVSSIENVCFSLENSIFLQMAFALINLCLYVFLARKSYAIDQEWSRYVTFMTINCIFQLIGLTVCFALAINSALDAWSKSCFSDARVAFILLMISIVFAYALIITQGISIIKIRRMLYSNTFRLAARKDDEEVIIKPTVDF
ncbi:unnamed protein product [Moneuplotes crassus]|uniref:Uncharacterized protein n=1 Tax=Euplotes crassus TaxID=5936 RepID=A0AAD1XYN9_EUPCR|nr:unnamed protein product [Moneuplotes crassus]